MSTKLAAALRAGDEHDVDSYTHGFHAYPARMHPWIAKTLLENFVPKQARLLDPFCGAGTVLVESLLAGHHATGVDLNPLAILIARVRCELRSPEERERFLGTLSDVAALSEERVRTRTPARAPLSRDEIKWYDPHVLKEFAGLREEILKVEHEEDRQALMVLLSAIVIKFSRQHADTQEQEREIPKRIRKGLVTEFFVRKGQELTERWEALYKAAHNKGGTVELIEDDARALPKRAILLKSFDVILTSPPYGGTYDYARHHMRRYPWLGIEPKRFLRDEIGARRNIYESGHEARWDHELGDVLFGMRKLLAKDGVVLIVQGDGRVGHQVVDAQKQIARLATRASLTMRAWASQERPDFAVRGQMRREHVLLLTHSD